MSKDSQYVHRLWHMEGMTLETACPKFTFFADFDPPEFFRAQEKSSTALPSPLPHLSSLFYDSSGESGETVRYSTSRIPFASPFDPQDGMPSGFSSSGTIEGREIIRDERSAFPSSSTRQDSQQQISGGFLDELDTPSEAQVADALSQGELDLRDAHSLLQRSATEEIERDESKKCRDARLDEVLALY